MTDFLLQGVYRLAHSFLAGFAVGALVFAYWYEIGAFLSRALKRLAALAAYHP